MKINVIITLCYNGNSVDKPFQPMLYYLCCFINMLINVKINVKVKSQCY